LSLNAGFLCPNIDGTLSSGGCIFCNNKSFSYFTDKQSLSLEEQIKRSMEFAKRRFNAEKFIAYFQSFTNTYADLNVLREKYEIIRKFPGIVGLSISTRPDCIDKAKLSLIESYARDYMVWLEYGLQTVHDESLSLLNRNHSFGDFLKSLDMAKGRNILVGAHVILGIPGESREDMLATAKMVSNLPLAGLKFHCLHVVKDTALDRLHKQKGIRLLSESEYVEIICDFLELIPGDMVILRLISEADKRYLTAPLWVNQKQVIIKNIEEEFKRRGSYQGRRYAVRV